MMASPQLSNFIDSESPLLMLRNIEKSYGKVQALNFSKLDLHRGDRVALTGANASGKSTLLRLLAGITCQTHGTLIRSEYMARLRIAYVPQSGGIDTKHSVQVTDIIDELSGDIDLLVSTDHAGDSLLRCNQRILLQAGQML